MTDAHGDGAPRRAVTLGDVARRAGVSQPTASRVLNGSARQVTEVYRQRVLAAARELGTRRPEGRTAAAHHPHPPVIRESTPPRGLQAAGDQVDAPEPLER